ncbi:aldose 1-epimerase [Mesorhizobium sp. B1-1-9]|uniref:aldose 1-epimerase n=1 Tax=Mesorhizobium sp. B1-1-9 TaxID=2589975 RepID=UPI001127629F|nr:aldose 1-epimerase [Mesorhizobium sp. B1-1-9]TPN50314.1 aldose 1-epimerase [Mesorhizobium sp. B1-1-9]
MAGLLELRDGRARLVLAPEKGAAIARFDALVGDVPVPLLRPGDGTGTSGCQLLVPWSNRISGGGFECDGRFHAVEPNVPGEAFPIHGDGFQREWRIAGCSATEAELVLDAGGIGPYRYEAQVVYALHDGVLDASLTVQNRASIRLPYGLGFHPWFPRRAGTTLEAKAARVWLEDERHLPVGIAPVADYPEWDFSRPSLLPPSWVNNAFGGWDRHAAIMQPEDGITLSLTASSLLDVFILYSPSTDAGYFCFEPVSHLVDAHHSGGMMRLEEGATMSANIRMGWSHIG